MWILIGQDPGKIGPPTTLTIIYLSQGMKFNTPDVQ